MAVVQQAWIVANFKETQLGKMRRGQIASVHVDAIPDHDFQAVVDSFSPGSGSTFTLLPPDNATGNFTKIVQRVPVKLYFTKASSDGWGDRLVPGLSCEVDVDLQSGPGDQNADRSTAPLPSQPQ
jgi:membrane fusion protein (multidrug efflux system)